MDKVGILVVSKCLSAAAIIDTFARSERYSPEFYVAERQVNPLNFKRAKVHEVIPDLNVGDVAKFAEQAREADRLRADRHGGLCHGRWEGHRGEGDRDPDALRHEGVRGRGEQGRPAPALREDLPRGATRATWSSTPKEYPNEDEAVAVLKGLAKDMTGGFVIKPDAPARGAGVGVWGKDFRTEEEAVAFFLNVYSKGRVVVEERIEGEESSFHAFSDGRHFVAAPLTRDYKRALDGDKGKLTGGMGSYRGPEDALPSCPLQSGRRSCAWSRDAFERVEGAGARTRGCEG